MLLTIKQCFLAILSPIWKLIGVCLVVFSLLIVGCGGGGGGGGGGGSSSGGNGPDNIIMVDNGTGGGANGTGPAKAQWAILAQTNDEGDEEIAIRWHNVKSFESAGAERFSVKYTVDGQEREPYSSTLSAFENFYNTINATGLIGEAGEVYKFGPNITVTYANGTIYMLPIEWGTDPDFIPFVDEHGPDGVAIPSDVPLVVVDPGGSVCRITDDAADCDGDGLNNTADACPAGQSGWTWAMGGNTDDDDGDGCHNDEDIDDDGDGLIEISTAEELDAVRYQLDGTGQRLMDSNDPASLNQTGCGGAAGRDECNGYELMEDIDLATFSDGKGWSPIVEIRSRDGSVNCSSNAFTGIFDGNGHIVSGLFINRSGESCVGLFGNIQSATIRDLGVIAHNIIGDLNIGGLVANDWGDSSIIRSFVIADKIRGERAVGGLIGQAKDTKIVGSYAVTRMLHSTLNTVGYVGGLVGIANQESNRIVQSYAVSGSIRANANYAGGLIGSIGSLTKIIQSYAVSESVYANVDVAGLVGRVASGSPEIIQSYTVTGSITALRGEAAIVLGEMSSIQASYWDSTTSGIKSRTTSEGAGAEPKTSLNLTTPTGYSGIYAAWDGGSMIDDVGIAALNTTGTRWCDTDLSGAIEGDEDEDDNRVWDFGTDTDYPAIRCTPDSLAEQRDWWSLNATGKPELDRALLNDWLDGSLP